MYITCIYIYSTYIAGVFLRGLVGHEVVITHQLAQTVHIAHISVHIAVVYSV